MYNLSLIFISSFVREIRDLFWPLNLKNIILSYLFISKKNIVIDFYISFVVN